MGAGPNGSDFPSSQWSLIARAGAADRDAARTALADLCARYWYPVYAFVRRQAPSAADADDLTSGFFAHVLDSDLIPAADPTRGRFRNYILDCCRNYIKNDRRAQRSKKNGGHIQFVSLDFGSAATRYAAEPADPADPDVLFRRRWALTLLDEVFAGLEAEYGAAGQGAVFTVLKSKLVADGKADGYADLAVTLNMTEPAVRKAAQRLRDRFRDELRGRVAQTVANPADVDDEIRDLLTAMR